ncbi:MAG TPA: 50S ribosomal protein L23 [Sphaerochaeta sp.]|jgi:large subunit ribosomal protein L23|nr:50S ribosomal protein L23 [Spirochaetota bacterium]NLV60245.1 50S ribosomal protein L23 [Spirochaetales bacterium]HOE83944.1 50S ribosomal protein L23 [Sphaerochaeta sp.]HOQ94014.1 50S ribosomal protein L23 [Sphaerochaeta sp.]HPK46808.1 50S ribosomal protein L23 [Sphaerochaeta sp.]
MRADQIIIEPILSEKTNIAREGALKKYTFKVRMDSNKFQIARAMKEIFGVEVVACNVMIVKGKPKYSRGKGGSILGNTGDWKKAVVTLAKGESIQAIEGV